jgi:SpoVK/Ycf46/Vps4 family AAA+-type ATPase
MKKNTKRKFDNSFDSMNKKNLNNMIYLNLQIKNIDDLIYLGLQYIPDQLYNINLEKIYTLLPVLMKLKKVIGMEKIKKTITDHIIFFIQNFQDKNSDMLHIVIQGPPGVGKTMLGKIIAEIYYKLNIIESNNDCSLDNEKDFKFTIARRSDLIGKYLGHTAIKTQEVIDKSLGGVLFIDEAYSLGNLEGKDSFSKECIDTINQNLTEKKNQFLVIIAGYKDALDNCFFTYNEGLRRRFPFIYTIEKYSPSEMSEILKLMIEKQGPKWEINIDKEILDQYFENHINLFTNSAGDIESLIFLIKIEHSKRVFYELPESHLRKKITKLDIDNAIESYKNNKEKKNENISNHQQYMYI